jgi:hypothetical protein
VAFRDDDLTLYRVGGDHPASAHRGVLVAAHLIWLAALIVGAIGSVLGLRAKRSR